MGVLEIVIISLIVILFFSISGISVISRLLTGVFASIRKVLFDSLIEDDDEQREEKNQHRNP